MVSMPMAMAVPPADYKREVEVVVIVIAPTIVPMFANVLGMVKPIAVAPAARPVAMVILAIP
jgi:hypothetical protein